MKDFLMQLTKENQKELKEYIDKTYLCHGFGIDQIGDYYGIIDGNVRYIQSKIINNFNKQFIIQSLSELEEKTFPRYMMVGSVYDRCVYRRLVLGKFNAKYIAIQGGYEKYYEEQKNYSVATWEFVKEIEEPKILEITIDEIAKKFNVNPEQIKIKK
jgi:hypothetical protein